MTRLSPPANALGAAARGAVVGMGVCATAGVLFWLGESHSGSGRDGLVIAILAAYAALGLAALVGMGLAALLHLRWWAAVGVAAPAVTGTGFVANANVNLVTGPLTVPLGALTLVAVYAGIATLAHWQPRPVARGAVWAVVALLAVAGVTVSSSVRNARVAGADHGRRLQELRGLPGPLVLAELDGHHIWGMSARPAAGADPPELQYQLSSDASPTDIAGEVHVRITWPAAPPTGCAELSGMPELPATGCQQLDPDRWLLGDAARPAVLIRSGRAVVVGTPLAPEYQDLRKDLSRLRVRPTSVGELLRLSGG